MGFLSALEDDSSVLTYGGFSFRVHGLWMISAGRCVQILVASV